MRTNDVHFQLVALFASALHAVAVGQSVTTPAPSPLTDGLAARLLDDRAKEIRATRPGNKDVDVAVDLLVSKLKLSAAYKQTVIAPCPPAPAPAPSSAKGLGVVIGSSDGWSRAMPSQIEVAARELESGSSLTSSQKDALSNFVAPEFKRPGDRSKFETVMLPGCPAPSPAPAGQGGRPDGARR